MKHPTEEMLIAYQDGDAAERETVTKHLGECGECRAELERIGAMLTALGAIPTPDPGEEYGARVWEQILPRLPEKRARWWDSFALGRKAEPRIESMAAYDATARLRRRALQLRPRISVASPVLFPVENVLKQIVPAERSTV
jgi:anti-sigma factor RsiW